MDQVQQLGEMLKHYAQSEEHKKQQFEAQCSHWSVSINGLFERIEQWLQPLRDAGLVELAREPYLATSASFPAPVSPFASHKLVITLALRTVEFVPEAMGAKGQISLAVMGLTSDRYGSISVVCTPPAEDWLWRKERGVKDPEVHPLTADFLALQLQALIPRQHRE
ncbi:MULTISPECIES: hypothetical protein [Pseudomonas]|uniref:Uncharacterized protein n=1 Tax=Pseudomonas eucalypticola TaxID=2599595 RepID=A0A7D5D6P9_9PSED|nr:MULTISPECIES: hypothetical protein [Pseudomonas]QKZ04340.1 hypothetical protein HWQ56_11300 [Pseudomonas eucalypticola]